MIFLAITLLDFLAMCSCPGADRIFIPSPDSEAEKWEILSKLNPKHPVTVNDDLVISLVNESYFKEEDGTWPMTLKCGKFLNLGDPPIDLVWNMTNDAQVNSTIYDNGSFILTLTEPIQEGNYSCALKKNSVASKCHPSFGKSDDIRINRTLTCLSLVQRYLDESSYQVITTLSPHNIANFAHESDARVKHLENRIAKMNDTEVLLDTEIKEFVKASNATLADMQSTINDLVIEDDSLKKDIIRTRNEIVDLEAKYRALKEKRATLEDELATMTAAATTFHAEILQAEKNELSKSFRDLQNKSMMISKLVISHDETLKCVNEFLRNLNRSSRVNKLKTDFKVHISSFNHQKINIDTQRDDLLTSIVDNKYFDPDPFGLVRSLSVDSLCRDGFYGQNCSSVCGHCANGTCSKTTGECACQPGWIPPLCQNSCNKGMYGQDCEEICGHCLQNQICNKTNGWCNCDIGWKAPLCNQECDKGTFGKSCSEKCDNCVNGTCDKQNGFCNTMCVPGWNGTRCDHLSAPPPPTPCPFFVVYIVIAAVGLVVALIILIVVYRKCARSDTNQRCSAPRDDQSYMDINSSIRSYVSIRPNLPKFSREVFADNQHTSGTVRHLESERPETAQFSSITQNDEVQNDKSPNPCSYHLKGYEIHLSESRFEAENDDQLGHNRQMMNDPDGYLRQYTLVRRIVESDYLHPTVSVNSPNSSDCQTSLNCR